MFRSFRVFLNYDHQKPIGILQIGDDISEDVLRECAIVPELLKIRNDDFQVFGFGLIPRTTVNTGPLDIRS